MSQKSPATTTPPATDPAAGSPRTRDTTQPVGAGVITALVGFTSSFAVVLSGLTAVGATPAQAAS